jgi:esterase/lipase
MVKIVYIIPGFMQNTNLIGYKKIISFFKNQNFKIVPINISWKFKTMKDYLKEFMNQFKRKNDDEVFLFGFSFGAMIAFISSKIIKPKMLILCSLSPYFKEDLIKSKIAKKEVGKRRFNEFLNYDFNKIAKEVKCKTILIVGKCEPFNVFKKSLIANKKISNSKLIVVNNAKHDISQNEYLECIKKFILKL